MKHTEMATALHGINAQIAERIKVLEAEITKTNAEIVRKESSSFAEKAKLQDKVHGYITRIEKLKNGE